MNITTEYKQHYIEQKEYNLYNNNNSKQVEYNELQHNDNLEGILDDLSLMGDE